ncbi:MAG: hypothetical protein WDA59_04570 [Methanofastidiosum sp.]|jgi:hypothetical protein|nr:hypothetical protein [Alkaliphilus sp.]NMA30790.1 hypothetical protein [Candidatus Methanofastidiosa archaeon]
MNYKIKRIGIVSTIKVASTFGIVFGILIGIITSIISAFTMPGAYLGEVVIIMLILGPVMGAVGGLIGGAFWAGIFNFLCGIFGGPEFNLKEQLQQG